MPAGNGETSFDRVTGRLGHKPRDTGEPRGCRETALFETSYVLPQPRLFALDEAGWLKAPKLEGYAPRRPSGPMALQEVLFSYLDAL